MRFKSIDQMVDKIEKSKLGISKDKLENFLNKIVTMKIDFTYYITRRKVKSCTKLCFIRTYSVKIKTNR